MIDAFIKSAEAGWRFMLLISNGPLGAYAVLASLLGSLLVLAFARRWLRTVQCTHSREFIAELAALVAGIAAAWVPMPTVHGFLIGVLAGLAAPFTYKGAAMVLGLAGRWLTRKVAP